MTDKMLEQQRRRMDWAERDDRMVEEIGHGPQPDAVYDPETGSEYQPSATRPEEVTEMNQTTPTEAHYRALRPGETEALTGALAEALAHIKAHGMFTADELRAIGEHLNSTDEEG